MEQAGQRDEIDLQADIDYETDLSQLAVAAAELRKVVATPPSDTSRCLQIQVLDSATQARMAPEARGQHEQPGAQYMVTSLQPLRDKKMASVVPPFSCQAASVPMIRSSLASVRSSDDLRRPFTARPVQVHGSIDPPTIVEARLDHLKAARPDMRGSAHGCCQVRAPPPVVSQPGME